MAKTTEQQTFTKGLNKDASPFVLDPSQLADVQNLLFERGLLHSRPGVGHVDSTTPSGSVPLAVLDQLFNPLVPTPSLLVVYQSGGIGGPLKLRTTGAVTSAAFLEGLDATGPALTPTAQSPVMVPFNNINMLAGFNEGIVRYDGLTNTYTIPHIVPYTYLTVHLSRVIAACSASGASPTALQEIAWCKIGDETVWSGTYDSGSAILQEAEDGITGLRVVRNVIVVARAYGFHIGVPTGTAVNPYDWKCFSKDEDGCAYPDTLAKAGGRLFFMSDSDVCTFDLAQVQSIGEGVKTELFDYARSKGVSFRGFITRTYKSGARPQYHIIPYYTSRGVSPGVAMQPLPHFIYDIQEGMWSRHVYEDIVEDTHTYDGFPYNFLGIYNNTAQLIPRTSPGMLRWRVGDKFQYRTWGNSGPLAAVTPCESSASFSTGRIQLLAPDAETALLRMLLVINFITLPGVDAITLKVENYLGNTVQTLNLAPATTPQVGWQRLRWNAISVGQFFQFTLTIAAGANVQIRQLVIEYENAPQEVRV